MLLSKNDFRKKNQQKRNSKTGFVDSKSDDSHFFCKKRSRFDLNTGQFNVSSFKSYSVPNLKSTFFKVSYKETFSQVHYVK